MKIMLDLDRVVYNSENFVRSMAEIFDITNCGGNGIKNKNKFCLYKCYDWNNKQNFRDPSQSELKKRCGSA